MCADFTLDRNNGAPNQPQQVEKTYKMINVCRSQNLYESWSKQSFSDAIYAEVKNQLPALNVELCRVYGSSMDETTYATYC